MGTFCDFLRVPLPALESLDPEAIPEPYHHLLVHEGDMTGRLMKFHQSEIHLETLRVVRGPRRLERDVLLQTREGETVEFGAILIYLDGFSGAALEAVNGCRQPLGGILNRFGITYRSDLGGFFSIRADASLGGLLALDEGTVLYGRFNRLLHGNDSPIADVVEILPPTDERVLPTRNRLHGE